jgi:hypothetical protein
MIKHTPGCRPSAALKRETGRKDDSRKFESPRAKKNGFQSLVPVEDMNRLWISSESDGRLETMILGEARNLPG